MSNDKLASSRHWSTLCSNVCASPTLFSEDCVHILSNVGEAFVRLNGISIIRSLFGRDRFFSSSWILCWRSRHVRSSSRFPGSGAYRKQGVSSLRHDLLANVWYTVVHEIASKQRVNFHELNQILIQNTVVVLRECLPKHAQIDQVH